MTMNDIEIRISIIDPNFESAVLQVLAVAEIQCHGRYLTPREIPLAIRAKTILITSNEGQHFRGEGGALSGFIAVIPVSEILLQSLPTLISDAYPKEITQEKMALGHSSSLVKGVMPRVGARTLNELIGRNMGEEIFAIRKQNSEYLPPYLCILCAEVDDACLTKLFGALDKDDVNSTKIAVVINKLPNNSKGRRKFGAIERELLALSVQLAIPISFDGEIQITGLPGKQTMSAVQPLFDWIANSK
jgi:hypothetical protein